MSILTLAQPKPPFNMSVIILVAIPQSTPRGWTSRNNITQQKRFSVVNLLSETIVTFDRRLGEMLVGIVMLFL